MRLEFSMVVGQMKKVGVSFSLILIYCLFLFPIIGFANSAPIYQPEPNGSLIPLEDSPVVVKGERLQFILSKENYLADVVVDYTFYNPANEVVDSLLAFPYTPAHANQTVKIWINDEALLEEKLQIYENKKEYHDFLTAFQSTDFLYVDPITGEDKGNWTGYDMVEEAKVVTFPVRFPAKSEISLRLEYQQESGIDKSSYINWVELYQYMLQPASAWEQFNGLEVQVAVPKDQYFASNLPMEKLEEDFGESDFMPGGIVNDPEGWDVYRGKYDKLPSENLAFSTTNDEGTFFGIMNRDFYDIFGFSLELSISTLVIIGTALVINRFDKGWLRWIIGPILSFGFANTFALLLYAFLINVFPVVGNGNWIGGYGIIFTFFILIIYNSFMYFPIMMLLRWKARRLEKLDSNQ